MRLFITIHRGYLHKTTQRIDIQSSHPTTDDVIEAVAARLGYPPTYYKISMHVDKNSLRIVTGWPLGHYNIRNGCTLHVEFFDKGIKQTVQSIQEEQEPNRSSRENSIISTKSSIQQLIDNKLEKLLGQARRGNLDGFCSILRQLPQGQQSSSKHRILTLLDQVGQDGLAAIHHAVSGGFIDMVRLLLIKNVDINLQTIHGWTPLMMAVRSQNLDIVRLLLQHPNIQVNKVTTQGTALCLAVDASFVQAVQILLESKADETLQGKNGQTARDLCSTPQIQRLLQRQRSMITQTPIILQGYVCKQSAFFQMQSRYLVCNPFKGTLTRYQTHKHYPKNPSQIIPLTTIADVKIIPRSEAHWLTVDKDFYFFQVFYGNRLIFGTKNAQITQLWVRTIFQSVGLCLLSKKNRVDSSQFEKTTINVSLTERIQEHHTRSTSHFDSIGRSSSFFQTIRKKNCETVEVNSPISCPTPLPNNETFSHPSFQKLQIEPRQSQLLEKSNPEKQSNIKSEQTLTSKQSSKQASQISLFDSSKMGKMFQKKSSIRNSSREVQQQRKIQFKSFQIMQKLGSGAFGSVYLAKSKVDGKNYALKALQKRILMLQRQVKYAIGQVNILKTVNHPFIVKLYYAFQTPKYLYMCLDYCKHGDMSEFLAYQQKMPEKDACQLISQLVLAIEHLHSRNILYRDLKPQNILLHEDGYIRLADFGLSKADCVGLANSFCGSPAYLSPQMLSQKGVSKQADIYGIGCILYEMLTGDPPYFIADLDKLYQRIRQGRLEIPGYLSAQAKDILKLLLKNDPTRRPSTTQLKAHPFFRNINFNDIYNKTTGSIDFTRKRPKQSECEGSSSSFGSEKLGSSDRFSDEDYEGDARPNRILKFSFRRQDQ